MTMDIPDKELKDALGIATEAINGGPANGRIAAARVVGALAPILLASPDPRLKALGIALGIASEVFVKQRKKKLGVK